MIPMLAEPPGYLHRQDVTPRKRLTLCGLVHRGPTRETQVLLLDPCPRCETETPRA